MYNQVKALLAHRWNEAPLIETVPYPIRRAGESIIRIEAAVISHLDLTVLGGEFDIRPQLPYIGGVEGAGKVIESESFEVGTRVAARGGGIGLTRAGTWAEYVAIPDSALRAVSDSLRPEIAATSFSPLTTAYIALHDIGRLGTWDKEYASEQEVVVVTGAGGAVGAAAVQLAVAAGAKVIGVVSSPDSARAVPAGAQIVVQSDVDAVLGLTERRNVSLLVDTVGGPSFETKLGWIRPGGRAAIVGYTAGADIALNLPNWLLGDVTLLPVNLLRREARAVQLIDRLNQMIIDGAIHFRVETFSFRDASRAFQRIRSGEARGKVAIMMNDFGGS